MNVSFRRQAGIVAIIAGALLLGGMRESVAQVTPSNPLRPVTKPQVTESSRVELATALQPVRASVASDDVLRSVLATPGTQPVAPYGAASYDSSFRYGSRVAARRPTTGFAPRHARMGYSQPQAPIEAIGPPGIMSEPDQVMLEPLPAAGEFMDTGCCDAVGPDGCGVPDCGSCTPNAGCYGGCLIPCPIITLNNLELFAGVQGFRAPLNVLTGSFGFHYGANWAVPVPCLFTQPIGMQVGYRGVSSNYSGVVFSEDDDTDTRTQGFVTAGLFRRVDWGLQGGIVIDFMHDQWFYDALEFTQLRGELSWMFPQSHELGFWCTAGTKNSRENEPPYANFEPTDLNAFFYRRRFDEIGGGYGRLSAGFTGSGEGLIGVDFKLPLTASLALQSEFTYLIPKNGDDESQLPGWMEEAWNVGISLVWYPGRRKAVGIDYFRPLFDVADNGDFIVRPVFD